MNFKKYFSIFLFIFLIAFTSAGLFQRDVTCGDRTLEGECSVNKPYFCSDDVLIENASFCGCPNLTEINGSSCISSYQTNPKEVNLSYVVKGRKQNISFTVYKGMANYLFNLSDAIIYEDNETPKRQDFKFRNINEKHQKIFLMPLVIKIQNLAERKKNQARIAISLVQQIPFKGSDELISLGNNSVNYSRYPYEVLYDKKGVCASKSELMVFLLREIGYGTAFFYYESENHDSAGIRCPEKYDFLNTGYCFVETTGPSILTDNENFYAGGIQLGLYSKVMNVSNGTALGYMSEYRDAKILKRIRRKMQQTGKVNIFRKIKYDLLAKKYGLR